jgi:carbon-monoxide dehydrogenase medium subunit
MHNFVYHRPATVAEAVAILQQGLDAKIIAGGMTLIPTMKQRLAAPAHLVDLVGIGVLNGIHIESGRLVIGAMTPHADVARSGTVREMIPALASLAEGIGDPHVRNRGTIGGSIANNDPAADYPAAVLGLGATVHTNRRSIRGEEFFVDLFGTALDDGELITAISFPKPKSAYYAKFPQLASRFALTGVMVAQFGGDDVRVAVTGAGPCAFRGAELERALRKSFTPASIESLSMSPEGLLNDIHGTKAYRAHLITVMAKRAVAGCNSSG